MECIEPNFPPDMEMLYECCKDQATSIIFHKMLTLSKHQVYLFVAQGSWRQRSRIILYRKLQGNLPPALKDKIIFQEETLVESSEGVRYAGVAKISEDNFGVAIEILRKFSGAIIITTDNQLPKADQLFGFAFPNYIDNPKVEFDWPTLAASLCPHGNIVLRLYGSYDEKLVSINFMMLSKYISTFGE